MVANDVRAALQRRPFKPFDVCLSDGRALHVPHPDFAYMSPDKWDLIIWWPGGKGGYDFVDIGSITSLRDSIRNGGAKRRKKKKRST